MKKDKYECVAYWCIGIGVVCFVLYGIGLLYNEYSLFGEITDGDIERTAQIGDFFGGVVGSVWTLAGVLLYFSALRMQSQEIANQMKEMNDNSRLLKQQQFETTFFNLLKTQQELKGDIKGTFYKVIRSGQSYKYYWKEHASNDFFEAASKELNMFHAIYKRGKYQKWDEEAVDYYLWEYWSEQEDEYNIKRHQEYEEEMQSMFYDLNLDYHLGII